MHRQCGHATLRSAVIFQPAILTPSCAPKLLHFLNPPALPQDGLANLLLLGTHSVSSKSKVESSVPSKGAKGAKAAFADKAVTAFHKKVFDVLVRHVDWEVVRCLVIAGPGSAKDDFRKYLDLEMVRQNVRSAFCPRACSHYPAVQLFAWC